jgi:YbgC/YbaW family acyl-CoA thioester hydrolase
MPHTFTRPVHFDEIDAAGFVYFPKLIALAHEALERLLEDARPGGYAAWVMGDRIGLPCVHVAADFAAPLRFGDVIVVRTKVVKFGTTSVAFDIDVSRGEGDVSRGDGVHCAKIEYVVACAELHGPSKRALPPELREAIARYR